MKTLFVFLFTTSLAFSQVPQKIAFQGVLTDDKGVVKNVPRATIIFRLFTSASSSSDIWSESVTIPVVRGMFSHNLGENKPLSPSLFDKPLWLEIEESGFKQKRIELTANAYALRAGIAESTKYADTAKYAENTKPPMIQAVKQVQINGNSPFFTDVLKLVESGRVKLTVNGNNEIIISASDSVKYSDTSAYARNAPNDVPVGTIVAYALPTLPSDGKWLFCNGKEITDNTIPLRTQLISASNPYGVKGSDPRVPDLRAMFIRGTNNMGIDRADSLQDPDRNSRISVNGGASSNNLGSVQGDAISEHRHLEFGFYTGSRTLGLTATTTAAYAFVNDTIKNDEYNLYPSPNSIEEPICGLSGKPVFTRTNTANQQTSSETRPKNIYVNYIIRAKP
jgi:hypothetical protein